MSEAFFYFESDEDEDDFSPEQEWTPAVSSHDDMQQDEEDEKAFREAVALSDPLGAEDAEETRVEALHAEAHQQLAIAIHELDAFVNETGATATSAPWARLLTAQSAVASAKSTFTSCQALTPLGGGERADQTMSHLRRRLIAANYHTSLASNKLTFCALPFGWECDENGVSRATLIITHLDLQQHLITCIDRLLSILTDLDFARQALTTLFRNGESRPITNPGKLTVS